MKTVLPAIIKSNKGHIVSIASSAGHIGCPKQVDYGASRHAVAGFIEALRFKLDVCIFLNLVSLFAFRNTVCYIDIFLFYYFFFLFLYIFLIRAM